MSNPINVTIQANQVHLSEESSNVEHAARISQMNSLDTELKGLITAEQNRATTAESSLDTKIDTAVANLVDGAPDVLNTLKELSDALGGDENAATTLTTLVTTEQTRAEAAELVLRNDLSAEVNRATAAEAALQTNLTAEVSRATLAETGLGASIATEKSRAEAAEATLTNQPHH